jgi:hypothetical protein
LPFPLPVCRPLPESSKAGHGVSRSQR